MASSKVIAITSGKGGVGKTTVTANLGMALAVESPTLKVCLLDLDIGLSNLDLHLGLEESVGYSIIDYATGQATLDQVMISNPKIMNLNFIASSQKHFKEEISDASLKKLVNELRERFDLIIIDCPAGIEGGFQQAVSVADEVILVTQPDIVSARDVDKVKNLIEAEHPQISPWLIINKVNPRLLRAGHIMSIEDVVYALHMKLLGVVPDDIQAYLAVQKGMPVCLNATNVFSGQAFRNIAKRLLGEDVPVLDIMNIYQNPLEGFVEKIKDAFGMHP